jgi:hypothetical protein
VKQFASNVNSCLNGVCGAGAFLAGATAVTAGLAYVGIRAGQNMLAARGASALALGVSPELGTVGLFAALTFVALPEAWALGYTYGHNVGLLIQGKPATLADTIDTFTSQVQNGWNCYSKTFE